jgi:hypothetical protein
MPGNHLGRPSHLRLVHPEDPTRRIRFTRYYLGCHPLLMPFAVALRPDGHLCTAWMPGDSGEALASLYGLTRTDQGEVVGRAFAHVPNVHELRRLWLDVFDHRFAPLGCHPSSANT